MSSKFLLRSIVSLLTALVWTVSAVAEEEKPEWDVNNPPGERQTVSLDTQEITWSNVDVSPDGKTLVFDMLGDLFTVPIEGGDADPLLVDLAWSFQPRFSPDGESIAFISDRGGLDNLWVMDLDDKEPRALTEETENEVHNPYWHPDGDYLLVKKGFTSTRSIAAGEIWMVHLGGGGGVQLVERPGGEAAQKNIAEPAFSNDGDYVYYSQDSTPGTVWQYNKDALGQVFTVQRLELATGDVEQFVGGPGGAIRPTPSPDGQYLAFVRRTSTPDSALYVKDMGDGREWPLARGLDRDLQEANGCHGNTPAIAWTPDSASVVYWAGGKLHRVSLEDRQVQEIPVRVQVEKQVTPALRFPVEVSPEAVRVKMARWVQRSPAGEDIVFQALGQLWRRSGDGEAQRLTSQDDHFEHYPAFSRDGQRVAYTTWNDETLGSVRVIDAAGGEGRIWVDEPGIYIEPDFSPDGRHLVYRKVTGGYVLSAVGSIHPGIYLVEEGGEPRRLRASGNAPHFNAEGDRIFFTEAVEMTQLALKSIDLTGGDERTHIQASKATDLRVSPDGRWVAFVEKYDAYLAPFPQSGRTVTLGSGTTAFPVHRVSKRSGETPRFSADSSTLYWSHGSTLYERRLEDAFAHLEGSPEELPEPPEKGLDVGFDAPADRPTGQMALVGGRIITFRDAENQQEILEDGVLLVDGDRIAAVGLRSEVEIPSDAEVIDVSGKTLVPGFVDVHAHAAYGNSEIIPQQDRQQYSYLAYGTTTLHDPSSDTSTVFAAAEMQRAGRVVAPRLFSTGTILYGAHVPGYTAVIDSLDDALFHVRRLRDVGAITVKSYNQPRRDQRQQVIEAGTQLNVMVVPEGGAKFQHNMNQVVDGHTGLEHAIPIATGYDDVTQLWAATDVGYTPTLGVAYGGLSGELYWYDRTELWKDERLLRYTPRFLIEPLAIRRDTAPDEHYNHIDVARYAKTLRDRGVKVLVGAHGQREGLAVHWEMWMLEQGGFTPWEALRAGTIDGAWYLGLDGDIGSLEVGKLADVAIIEGNPLEDFRESENVTHTLLGGRLYEAATMNQIVPDTVERRPFFFEQEGGDTLPPATRERVRQLGERFGWYHGAGHGPGH